MASVNFHHLHYFWAVATDGNLTRTARRLRVAPSALSAQIRQLESQLGQPLFSREGRRLELTEAGTVALAYADGIFAAGDELVSTLAEGRSRQGQLRVGAVATLSRNFQRSFVRPVLRDGRAQLRLVSGSFDELLARLADHELDVVLSNRPAPSGPDARVQSHRLARQPVSIVCSQRVDRFRFPRDLADRAMILPGAASALRVEFDALCGRLGIRPRVIADVDDMATMRLLARDSDAYVLVPSVVVRDELRDGLLHELCRLPELAETFYAITLDRRYQHPWLRELMDRDEAQLLGWLPPEPTPAPTPPGSSRRRAASADDGARRAITARNTSSSASAPAPHATPLPRRRHRAAGGREPS